jgi:hypothetical protein
MKLRNFATVGALLGLLGFTSTGCLTHKTVVPLGNGYEEVSHPHHAFLDEPEPPRLELRYRDASGKVSTIWPSLYGVEDLMKDKLVLFVGDKAFIEPERVTHPRLFAVVAPELPLDITDELLWRWSQINGKDFNKTLKKYELVSPVQKNGGLEFDFVFWTPDAFGSAREDWPDQSTLQLTWKQLDDIMHAVKTKGVPETDLRWHTPYIGEKY